MEEHVSVRTGWLKAMYIYTLIGAGGFGIMVLFFPGIVASVFRFPTGDPAVSKLYGSVSLAAGLLAIPALRSPLRFIPLLLLQLVYKPIWLVTAALPLYLQGRFPVFVVAMSVIYLTYIIGNSIAVPFSYVFAKKPPRG
jgi:hypothetical protein